jgi:hypothetical protein
VKKEDNGVFFFSSQKKKKKTQRKKNAKKEGNLPFFSCFYFGDEAFLFPYHLLNLRYK